MRDVRAGDISQVCCCSRWIRESVSGRFFRRRGKMNSADDKIRGSETWSVWMRRARLDLAQWRGSERIFFKLLWMVHHVSKTKTCIFYHRRLIDILKLLVRYKILSTFSFLFLRFPILSLEKIKKIHRITRSRVKISDHYLRTKTRWSQEDQPYSVCEWDLLLAGQTMRPEARHRPESLVFLLKRRERSRVAAERIGGGYSLPFCSRGTFGLTRNSRHLFLSSFRPLASVFLNVARKTRATSYGFTLSRPS